MEAELSAARADSMAARAACASVEAGREWYVLRDLSRPNALLPAYKRLSSAGVDVFTPLTRRAVTRRGVARVVERPAVHDLLFAHATRDGLDPVMERTPLVQYRYMRGGGVMRVREADMRRFIRAVSGERHVEYFTPEQVSPALYGRRIRICGGDLNGMEGRLMTVRGSRRRRLIVTIEGLLAAAVEVEPQYIEILSM